MKVVVSKKEGNLCSLCFEPIEEGEECLMFFSRNRKAGQIHFRHWTCQYVMINKKRAPTLEVYKERIKFACERTKANAAGKALIKKKYGDLVVKCPKCDRFFLKEETKKLQDHLEGKHGINQE